MGGWRGGGGGGRRAASARRQTGATPPFPPSLPDDADADFVRHVNSLCTRALKAMLNGDLRALRGPWRDEVNELGAFCARPVAGGPANMPGALLAYVLLEMADGKWPSEQVEQLAGTPYGATVERMHGLLEDSGWRLALPGEEGDGTDPLAAE